MAVSPVIQEGSAGRDQPATGFARPAPWLILVAILALTVPVLHLYGRRWWCACGQPDLWVNDSRGEHNSQHLLDPYSVTHISHGLIYFCLFAWLLPRLSLAWRFVLTVALAAGWELIENSDVMIERYRSATVSIGYFGDSIANSLGDILSCAVGFWIARWVGWRWALVLVLVIEVVLLFWIRDNLLLTIIMPIWPVEPIKQWQLAGLPRA